MIPYGLKTQPCQGNQGLVAKAYPEEHRKLYGEMMRYLKQVGARIPKLNPGYAPNVYKKDKDYEKRVAWGPFDGQRPLDGDEKQAMERSSDSAERDRSVPGTTRIP